MLTIKDYDFSAIFTPVKLILHLSPGLTTQFPFKDKYRILKSNSYEIYGRDFIENELSEYIKERFCELAHIYSMESVIAYCLLMGLKERKGGNYDNAPTKFNNIKSNNSLPIIELELVDLNLNTSIFNSYRSTFIGSDELYVKGTYLYYSHNKFSLVEDLMVSTKVFVPSYQLKTDHHIQIPCKYLSSNQNNLYEYLTLADGYFTYSFQSKTGELTLPAYRGNTLTTHTLSYKNWGLFLLGHIKNE